MYVDVNDSVRWYIIYIKKKDISRNTRKTTTTWKPFLQVKITILLKYLSNFWRPVDLPLTGVNSVITSTKIYVIVVLFL